LFHWLIAFRAIRESALNSFPVIVMGSPTQTNEVLGVGGSRGKGALYAARWYLLNGICQAPFAESDTKLQNFDHIPKVFVMLFSIFSKQYAITIVISTVCVFRLSFRNLSKNPTPRHVCQTPVIRLKKGNDLKAASFLRAVCFEMLCSGSVSSRR